MEARPENTRENIKAIFKEIDQSGVATNEFYEGLKKWFKKEKQLSDKQFACLLPFRPNKD